MENNWYENFSMFKWNEDGSFTCKRPNEFSCDEVKSLAVALLWENEMDFEICGEDGCASNFDMYTPLYNWHNGMEYLVLYSNSEDWLNGREVTIYGKIPDDDEMSDINEYMERS